MRCIAKKTEKGGGEQYGDRSKMRRECEGEKGVGGLTVNTAADDVEFTD